MASSKLPPPTRGFPMGNPAQAQASKMMGTPANVPPAVNAAAHRKAGQAMAYAKKGAKKC